MALDDYRPPSLPYRRSLKLEFQGTSFPRKIVVASLGYPREDIGYREENGPVEFKLNR